MYDDSQTNQSNQADDSQNDQGLTAAPSLGDNPNPAFGAPAVTTPQAEQPQDDSPVQITHPQDPPAKATPASSPLEEIKKKALEQLSPLVDKLEQSPEEKYKTVMMMIQASDNQDLIDDAYEAAQKITDEKVRAEALLNIVNEINYFTQKG